MNELPRITPKKRNADDPIIGTRFHMMDFWSWSQSNLLEMTTRSSFSEFLVASAMDAVDSPREVWAPHDVVTKDGIRIEVKAAGYIQDYGQKKLSMISFGIAANRAWGAVANTLETEGHRNSDVYVFAVLSHKDKPTVDPSNVDQWSFYVLPTRALAVIPKQKTIQLSALKRLSPIEAMYSTLKQAILKAYHDGQTSGAANVVQGSQSTEP